MLYVSATLWIVEAVVGLLFWFKIFVFWRRGGLQFSDASAEAAAGVAGNKTLQRAAYGASKKAARTAIEGYGEP